LNPRDQQPSLTRRAQGVFHGIGFGGTLYGALVASTVALLPTRRGSEAERKVVHGIIRRMIPTSLLLGGIRLDVSGREHLADPALAQGYVLVANHASNLDPVALIQAVGRIDLTFVAKAETLRRPFLSRILQALPWLPVERDSLAALKKLTEDVKQRRATGWIPRLVVFPEGTRSEDGRLQPFKIGPFLLAAHLGVPILPVVLRGTFALHKKNAFMVYPGRIQVDIGAPIMPPVLTATGPRRDLAAVDAAAMLLEKTKAIFHAVPEIAPAQKVAA
jgi:1-acyl-sn-glycerol-3-phosphate acyltransferase